MLYLFVFWSFLCACILARQLLLKLKGIAAVPVPDIAPPQTNEHDVVNPPIKDKYDVFVSFRGEGSEEIRTGFLSHLAAALDRKKIDAFVDEKLEKGQEIWPFLVRAIQGSLVSVIIFSEDYASSRWCLNELVKIHECRDKYEQIAIPVFYRVDPTDIRHQTGSYTTAFVEHGKRYDPTTTQSWRDALNKSADLSGIKSSDFQNDAALLENIINVVLHQLRRFSKHTLDPKGLVGINKSIAEIEVLLCNQSKDVRMIGIWGMGGIGKTTIAEQVFSEISSEYEGTCFLSNVREESTRHGKIYLKEKLFSTLLEDVKIKSPSGLSEDIRRRIGRMKVLIVLDDVNVSDHLEFFGSIDNFGPGCRIIVTTRDKQLLIAKDVDDIYKFEILSSSDALKLFNLIALNQSHLVTQYHETSMRVVDYAKGIPLVLKVLGRLLHGKGVEVWESQLNKLEQMPSQEVYDVMRLSYDDLDRKEKKIFLDLACFFNGMKMKVDSIKALLKDDESDNSVADVLERLKDKALIIISEETVVSVHDIIQEIAWEIVRQESSENIGSQSQLADADDIDEVLENGKGTEAIRSIRMDLLTIERKKLKLSSNMFARMTKLQFLDFYIDYCHEQDEFVLLPEGLCSFPNKVRYLRWNGYPLKSLPDKFSAEKLVVLDLTFSRVEKLWNGEQNLVNLEQVNLFMCEFLKELPDFSKATNLEVLNASVCRELTDVHPSVFSLAKLEKLDLSFCSSLTCLTSNAQFSCLSHLYLEYCRNLTEFSVTSENMVELNLKGTRIKALPPSFGSQRKLEILDLESSEIESLPSCTVNLTRLQNLNLLNCFNLARVPELPPSLEILNLEVTIIESLPSCMVNLTRLSYLNLNRCLHLQALPELPPSLETLLMNACESLKTVLFPSTATKQFQENKKRVEFCNCRSLDEDSLMAIGLNARINVMKFAQQRLSALKHDYVENYDDYFYNHRSYQAVHVFPGSRVPEWLEYKTAGDSVIIDLSSPPPSPLFGFIFCFVNDKWPKYDELPKYGQNFEFKLTISAGEDDAGVDKNDSIVVYMSLRKMYTRGDHVCVMYDQRCSGYLSRRSQNLSRFQIKVTPWWLHDFADKKRMELKGFGVSLISTSKYDSFVREMELHDSRGISIH